MLGVVKDDDDNSGSGTYMADDNDDDAGVVGVADKDDVGRWGVVSMLLGVNVGVRCGVVVVVAPTRRRGALGGGSSGVLDFVTATSCDMKMEMLLLFSSSSSP